MFVFEFKCQGKPEQYAVIDEAIRTSQFIRNKCLRYWIDNKNVNGYDLNKYTAKLAKEKSINDAGWYLFREWLKYFAVKFGKVAVSVAPHYTSQECSNCGSKVKKSLSVRTHNL